VQLRWRWHKLLLIDRNSLVIIYIVQLRLAFHTSSFSRFPVLHFPPMQYGATFSSLAFSVLAFSAPPTVLLVGELGVFTESCGEEGRTVGVSLRPSSLSAFGSRRTSFCRPISQFISLFANRNHYTNE